jgi:hypothetical protein
MKRSSMIACVLLVFSACSAPTDQPRPTLALERRSQILDSEAEQAVNQYWSNQITRCGVSYFCTYGFFRDYELEELKDLSTRLVKLPLSDADDNSVEWKGSFEIWITASRIAFWSSEGWGFWGPWTDTHSPYTYRVTDVVKQSGKWIFGGPGGAALNYGRVDCSDLPKEPPTLFTQIVGFLRSAVGSPPSSH